MFIIFTDTLKNIISLLLTMPLLGIVLPIVGNRLLSRQKVNYLIIALFSITFILACYLLEIMTIKERKAIDLTLYIWGNIANKNLAFGFFLDKTSAILLTVVSGISLLIHIYSMHYMRDEPSYIRFFNYIAFFTFAMLLLVVSNNLLQLFFAWEMVGLASYLLIGFWFTNDKAVKAAFKAFLINRISDVGLLLGILVVFYCFHSFNYVEIFTLIYNNHYLPNIMILPGIVLPAGMVIGILLLIGALGKSAQLPFHTWLPDSMAGPLPVSALIHAATMVTAGIFLIIRVMPIIELSSIALQAMIIIGIMTCIAMGLVAMVQYDLKQILAYSTISQLGFMLVALGYSAYSAALAHLTVHAIFKALLFLSAGVVIVAAGGVQDIRKLGGLRKKWPSIYGIMLVASLSAIGVPGLAGFYSKDLILNAVHQPAIYYLLIFSILITTIYTMRMLFMTFYSKNTAIVSIKPLPWYINVPLFVLAILSIVIGWVGNHTFMTALHGVISLPFLLIIIGCLVTWFYYGQPLVEDYSLSNVFKPIYVLLVNKYWFEEINHWLVKLSKLLGECCYKFVDLLIIEKIIINSAVTFTVRTANFIRNMQTGYLYHYLLIMVGGVILLLYWLLLRL